MQDVLTMLQEMRRPRILIRAARAGVSDYRREVHLRRHLGDGHLPRSAEALLQLREIERVLNAQRREDANGYSLVQHVDVLIAMMGEAQVLRASPADT